MARAEGAAARLGSVALRLARLYHLELALVMILLAGWQLSTLLAGQWGGAVLVVFAATGLCSWPPARATLLRRWRAARARRRLLVALQAVGFAKSVRESPVVIDVVATLAGHRLTVRVPKGLTVADLERAAEPTAAAMTVSRVRVVRDRGNAAVARVSVVETDPLAGKVAMAWPLANVARFDLWRPVPIGVDEDGDAVQLSLPEHNLLLGGEPGAGKSAALSLLLAAAALDPGVKLWLLDGKQVELAPWVGCAEALVGPNPTEAIEVLEALRLEMDLRYAQLLAWRRRKVAPADGLGLQVVACDELAFFTAGGDRKQREHLADLLRDLVARGRAAGIIVLAATQKPSSDVVPTSLRDLFGYRWAMRCATREASDTVLGSGWSTNGYSAAEVDPATRGVGYLLHEGGLPVRLRAAYLDDDALADLAERATRLRNPETPT